MPLPKPNIKEEKEDFLSRCMVDKTMKKEYTDDKQRFAVCNSIWDEENKERSMVREYEKRSYSTNEEASFRAIQEDDGKRYIEGYAALYNQRSNLIFERNRIFYEEIKPGAFRDVLSENNDVYLTFNHSKDQVMARTVNDTLILKEDDKGLYFRALMPENVSFANDVYELVRSGTLYENSFGFYAERGNVVISETEAGMPLRSISKISKLLDISVVTKAAYANTEVAARQLEEFEREQENKNETKEENKDEKEKANEEALKAKKEEFQKEREKLKMKIIL